MTVWPTLRPYIPRNLTLFSLDDYHPAWMYPSSHCSGTTGPLCKRCRDGGWPRPPGCDNETEGLWVYPRYQASVFAPGRLGPDTKVLVVPHCRFVPPLIHFIPGWFTTNFGASISETTMRPNPTPRCWSCRRRTAAAARAPPARPRSGAPTRCYIPRTLAVLIPARQCYTAVTLEAVPTSPTPSGSRSTRATSPSTPAGRSRSRGS